MRKWSASALLLDTKKQSRASVSRFLDHLDR
jgi:hypothetical protein